MQFLETWQPWIGQALTTALCAARPTRMMGVHLTLRISLLLLCPIMPPCLGAMLNECSPDPDPDPSGTCLMLSTRELLGQGNPYLCVRDLFPPNTILYLAPGGHRQWPGGKLQNQLTGVRQLKQSIRIGFVSGMQLRKHMFDCCHAIWGLHSFLNRLKQDKWVLIQNIYRWYMIAGLKNLRD